MDANSIAQEVANHLRGRDDIGRAEVDSPSEGFSLITLVTQGGAYYEIKVMGTERTEADTAKPEGATQ